MHGSIVRIKSDPVIEPLTQEMRRKYNARATVESVTSDYLWIFELAPTNAYAPERGQSRGVPVRGVSVNIDDPALACEAYTRIGGVDQ